MYRKHGGTWGVNPGEGKSSKNVLVSRHYPFEEIESSWIAVD